MASRSATYAAIGASIATHVLVFVALRSVGERGEPEDDSFSVEIDIAPPAPEAEDPPVVPDQPEPAGPDTDDDTPTAAIEPVEPDPVVEPDIPDITIDAGVPIDATPADAGPAIADAAPDAPVDAPADPRVAAADAGPSDAGAIASASDAGAGLDDAGVSKPGPIGVGIDLAAITPPGDHLSVLVRFDRLRGTAWQKPAEAILAPMPDYRTIIGDRKVSIIDRIDLLVISTSDPRDVTATNLAGHTVGRGASVRSFLSHPKSPVVWTPARGGALGMINAPQFTSNADPRVYLTPLDRWIVLADRKHLGALADPSSGDLDQLPAPAALPGWVRKLPRLIALTGAGSSVDDGPAVTLSLRGLPKSIQIPMVGTLGTPDHMTAALTIHPRGFVVRGTLEFASVARAKEFADTVTRTRASLLASPMTTAPLKRLHAFHAINGLSLKQTGARVSFATSVSTADARAAMKIAAERTAEWYLRTLPSRR